MKPAILVGSILLASASLGTPAIAVTVAPTEEVPEEVLRTEIITGARSPIDNRPMTATEYAELQTEIKQLNEVPPKVSDKVRNTIALLKLRKFIKTVLPFIPIK
jgi:hypothetical protein